MTSSTTCAWFLLASLFTFSCVISVSKSDPIAAKDKLSSSSSPSANAIQASRFVSSSASSSSSSSTRIVLGQSDSHVTAQVGHPAYLKCAVSNLASDQAVSWVRRRDWHILTSGRHVYTADERFQILRPIASSSSSIDNEPLSSSSSSSSGLRKFDDEGALINAAEGGSGGVNLTEWILQIQFVQQRDAGLYICQVPTEKGMISHQVVLDVLVPDVFILGPKDLIVDRGTTLSLVCIVENSPIPPQFVFWYHNDKLLNYQPKREGVLVETEYSGRTHSKLEIVDAHETDTGNYTCSTSSGKPYSIYVQVLAGIGDQAAAMSRKNSAPSFTVFWQQLTVVHVVTLLHQLISRLFINAV